MSGLVALHGGAEYVGAARTAGPGESLLPG
jgi:hypothetical protein